MEHGSVCDVSVELLRGWRFRERLEEPRPNEIPKCEMRR